MNAMHPDPAPVLEAPPVSLTSVASTPAFTQSFGPSPVSSAPGQHPHFGRHLLAEFYDCNPNVLNNPVLIEESMKDAARACGATIVQSCFHRFNPYGVSGVVVIAESHLAIHTWPEFGYASVDLYTCGEQCDPKVAFAFLQEKLHSATASYTELKRGFLNETTNEMIKTAPFLVGETTLSSTSHLPNNRGGL